MSQTKKTRSELKREAIVSAAKAAFQEFGVKDSSMDKIAEMAEVSKRTVYNHFPSKEELVMHLLGELWDQALVQVKFDYRKDIALETQLGDLLHAEVSLIHSRDYLELNRVAFGHYLYHPEAIKEQFEKFCSQETVLQRWLKAAVEDKRLQDMDVQYASAQLHHLLKGSFFWPQLMGYEDFLPDEQKRFIIQDITCMFLGHYSV